jgi:DNA-binding LytR/AlgR family response regulator
MSNYVKPMAPQLMQDEKELVFAHEVKLSADVILKKDDAFFIKQNYRFVKLKMEDLVYVEADRNHSYLVMKQQKFIVRMPLVEVIDRLSSDTLVRIHRSFAINTQFVDEFNDSEILVNGKSFPLTTAYRDDFFKKFNVV